MTRHSRFGFIFEILFVLISASSHLLEESELLLLENNTMLSLVASVL